MRKRLLASYTRSVVLFLYASYVALGLSPTHEDTSATMSSGITGGRAQSSENFLSFGAKPNDPSFNSRSALQGALAALATRGGGTLYLPKGQFYIDFPDIANDINARDPAKLPLLRTQGMARNKLILVPPGITLQGEADAAGNPLTQIHWKATSFPVFSFVNSDGSGIKNIAFVFDGTQPGFYPWSQEQYLAAVGVNTASVGGPHELSTVIYTIGSEGLTFENLTFSSGASPRNNEHTFAYGIVSKGKGAVPQPTRQAVSQIAVGATIPGPALLGQVRGNVFRSLKFSDFVCGILASGQQNPVFENISGNYRGSWYPHEPGQSVQSLPGPGHLIYITAQPVWHVTRSADHPEGKAVIGSVVRTSNMTMRDIKEGAETLSNINSLGTLALKDIDGGTVQNVQSQHPAGLITSMVDAHNLLLQDLTWSSSIDLCSDPSSKLNCGMPAIQVIPGGYPGLDAYNDHVTFKNLTLRSPRWAAIFKISAAQPPDPSKMNRDIVVDGLTIQCSPALHTGQKSAGGIIEVQAANTHFSHVIYTPVVQAVSSSTALDNACQVWAKSTDVTIDISVHRIPAIPAANAPAYKCLLGEHQPGNESVGLKNGCSITEHLIN